MKTYLFGSFRTKPHAARDIDIYIDTEVVNSGDYWPALEPRLVALHERTKLPIDFFVDCSEESLNWAARYDGHVPQPDDESVIKGMWRWTQRFLGKWFFDGAVEVDLDDLHIPPRPLVYACFACPNPRDCIAECRERVNGPYPPRDGPFDCIANCEFSGDCMNTQLATCPYGAFQHEPCEIIGCWHCDRWAQCQTPHKEPHWPQGLDYPLHDIPVIAN